MVRLPRLLILALLALPLCMFAQAPRETPPEELHATLAELDTALFTAFNNCDIEKFPSFFSEDVEFCHDQAGPTVGVKILIEQLKSNICGKVRRELVAGTLQAYPMHGYGAVQMGDHLFYPHAKGSEPTGIAKFIHLWQKKDGVWKITRVISYDHKAAPK